jgi:hypothetical protein
MIGSIFPIMVVPVVGGRIADFGIRKNEPIWEEKSYAGILAQGWIHLYFRQVTRLRHSLWSRL